MDACMPDLEFLSKWYEPELLKTLEGLLAQPASSASLTPRRSRCCRKSGKNFEFPDHWGADLQSEHERYLTEELFKKPVIVTDYPKEIKAFYMRAQRRRQDRRRDGRAGAAHRRDHRRQPARGAPRRAAGRASASRPRTA